ncbi:MAG: hypothetical protein B6I36_05205 [Desulfobacteraceae bacterium 4572_35.1]|nr:MAG: hypothetical protein B6I36_05205 [Desulfobacteraceae bacterium 4572_35.1]
MADKHNKLREDINKNLQSFTTISLHDASIALLGTLGYKSDKTIVVPDSDPNAFLELLSEHNSGVVIDKEKALFGDWEKADILFQLTDEELSTQQTSLFKNDSVNSGLLQSYLFFAIELKQQDYARGKLTAIARQLNRVFPLPVMVFIKHRDLLSIAVINRRINKRDNEKDVLGKVTIICDISLLEPHRGHLDILDSFAFSSLITKTPIHNFDTLHAAWEEIFNVELLNEKFYRELSNWYFWARQNVRFPHDNIEADKDGLFKDDESVREHDAKNLIRLLTRLLFVWFIKEKELVPEQLFDVEKLQGELLNQFDPASVETSYYKAILQNLFFATLNQTQGKREFRKDKQHHNVTTLMRYKDSFRNPDAFIDLLESVVPFMNGGLFECLDMPHPTLKGRQGGAIILHEDGFSEHKDNVLEVPDFLFFGDEQVVDLSTVYGDKKRKKEKVRGIIPILNNYKFTMIENTPIDQEIALDPELLGKVFENLLASYNSETKTTARKQTGSFYTPRTIVDYMVDKSLKSHLKKELCSACSEVLEGDADEGLEILFAYTEKEHAFTVVETYALIKAIDNCKILDPACGSGAYPMGVLHKLEFILGKLDKNNQLWRDRQIEKVDATIAVAEKIDDTTIRESTLVDLEAQKEDIKEAFASNELGYGRKLYLIENCIYGVDIQAIATQVSRLRFFISLIVDQKVNAGKDNFGIRPLPNLEAKFATADTLIQIEKPDAQGDLFDNPEVRALEKELKKVRHEMFGAKTPKTKRAKRKRDKELREDIAEKLISNGWSNTSARQLAGWDPYDQNASSSFFDPEWMFDLKGFDIVIGNPPYVQIQKFSKEQKNRWIKQKFQTYAATADIYCLFYERGAQLLNESGYLCYITSNKWMRAGYGGRLRTFLSGSVDTTDVLDFGMAQNFGAATTYTNILGFKNSKPRGKTRCCYASDDRAAMADPESYFNHNAVAMLDLDENAWVVITPERYRIKQAVEAQGIPLEKWSLNIYRGVLTGFNDAFYLTQEQRDELIAKEPHAVDLLVPLLRGRYVGRYETKWDKAWMIGTFPSLDLNIDKYPKLKKHLERFLPKLNQTGESFVSEDGKKEKTRKKTENEWFETQDSIGYQAEFRKPKIIYPNMTKYLPFYYDESGHFFINDKAFIVTSENESLPYLTAVLNSSLFKCCFRDIFPELMGNTYEVRKVFVDKIQIKKSTGIDAALFEKLVSMVQLGKREGLDALASFLEELIDACVLELYFPDEAMDKNLLFMDEISALLHGDNASGFVANKEAAERFFATANAPEHPIRNRLLRLTADSPDLFAVIKNEGKV